jgi:CubicO group peptidase (beta-lactamase class C family)
MQNTSFLHFTKYTMNKLSGLLFFVFISTCALAQRTQDKIDTLLTAYVKENKFNGTVLVAQKGNVIYQKGFGYKDAAQKQPVDVTTVFQIGSITKQFTAAVIMQLQQEGKLSVADKLSKFFPGFTNGDKITIEHLLTHTSGIYNYTNGSFWAKEDPAKHRSQAEMLAMFKGYPADFEPGTNFNYSNSGYSILGYIIEQVTKKPYEQVVRERILQPLGMTHSGFDFTHLNSPAKAKGYFGITGDKAAPAPIVDSTVAYAAGALYSTVNDLYKWERAIYTSKILQPESWKLVFTPYKRKYGFGWIVDSTHGRLTTAHGGGIHGFTSYLLRFPQEELAVILLDNTSGASLAKIANSLAAIVLNEPYEVPSPKKEIKVDEAIMQQYVGTYQLMPTFSIVVSVRDKRLFAQATNQEEFEVFAETENRFFLKVTEASLEFLKDAAGNVSEVILSQNGRQIKGKKVK